MNKIYHPCLCFVLLFVFSFPIPAQAKEVTQKYKDLTINANLEMAEGKDFKGGMVLIVHAYLAHNKMEIIRTAQQALLDIESSSLAINLSLGIDNRRGYHGCELPHRHIQDNALYEISAWVEWLRNKGVSDITLMGHSKGANQAMVYAVENLDKEVRRLVLLAPGQGEEIKGMYMERYGVSLDKPLAHAMNQIATGKGNELMQDIDILICPRINITAYSFVSYNSENNKFRNFRTYLPKSPIPTLIIAGSSDERQPNIVELVTPFVDGEHIQVGVIEGAGHFFRDFNIDEAMEAAVEFLEETK